MKTKDCLERMRDCTVVKRVLKPVFAGMNLACFSK